MTGPSLLAHDGHAADGPGWLPLLPVALLAGGYVLAAVRDSRGWAHRRTAAWLAGCALLAVAVGPLAQLPDDPRGHMAQHLLLGMFAPLGLVLGAPVTLLLRAGPPPVRRMVGRLLRFRPLHLIAHPVTAALLSTGGLALVLLTPLYAVAERQPTLHHALHLHYVAAGYLFAWSLAGPDPAPRRPGLAVRVGAAARRGGRALGAGQVPLLERRHPAARPHRAGSGGIPVGRPTHVLRRRSGGAAPGGGPPRRLVPPSNREESGRIDQCDISGNTGRATVTILEAATASGSAARALRQLVA
ncbi:cytochrome c oxidase assembly protein [Micromonospora sp. STR1_7]|uniref:Cytochrome c oxidase assembly protein n=1 Tax=Micromonospora parastrephiae TaxID=2806101 RepID=A0ABS1XTD8_9ACTN|nr:cytochrome c oxidase assembly protein [Micromonospora parastrephiae]MBM0232522.1 cytochrome c oxidase assembly protein [Micromonospora parastrephiae]